MTIKVKVSNLDTREDAVVLAFAADPETGEAIIGGKAVELKGQESTDIYVHSGQSIVVKEMQNGPKQEPAELAEAAG